MIPTRIQPFFTILSKNNSDSNTLVKGMLTCCNAHNFEINVIGKNKYNMFSQMHLFPDKDHLVVEARCKKCGKAILVFDSSCDGYEQHENIQKKYNMTCPVSCRKCTDNDFSINVMYEYSSLQELEDLEIREKENAFTWIWIDIECNKCKSKYKKFVDYETS